jgi:hypothetical protein
MRSDDLELDFKTHKSISEGLRRIKKRRIPVYEGKQGALPPIVDALPPTPLLDGTEEPNKEQPLKPSKSRYQSTSRRDKIVHK